MDMEERIFDLEVPESAFLPHFPEVVREEILEWVSLSQIPPTWPESIIEALEDDPSPETLRDWIVEYEKQSGGALNFF